MLGEMQGRRRVQRQCRNQRTRKIGCALSSIRAGPAAAVVVKSGAVRCRQYNRGPKVLRTGVWWVWRRM